MSGQEQPKSKAELALQRAWASGVFDARMTIPRSGIVLRFESVDEALIRRFHDVTGVGQVAVDSTKHTNLPVHIFRTINMEDSYKLIRFVSPFLSPMKLRQAAEVLARIERNPTWIKKKKATSSDTSPAPTVEARTTPQNTALDG